MSNQAATRVYWIHALTPLHVGAGRGIGFVDLPIMREAVTNWPFVPGSAVKGVLADYHRADEGGRDPDKQETDTDRDVARLRKLAFGSAKEDDQNAGSLVLTDARLVCLPVRSLFGTFAWCTSPIALERLRRDFTTPEYMALTPPQVPDVETLIVPQEPTSALQDHDRAFFEDLDFKVTADPAATAWAGAIARHVFTRPDEEPWQILFRARFAIVADDIFNFLCDTATQVDARVRIADETKTVANGQLWYEESLPAESILAGIAWCGPVFGGDTRDDAGTRGRLIQGFCSGDLPLQIGGKASIGRGQVRLVFTSGSR